jgi:hypothetical protein
VHRFGVRRRPLHRDLEGDLAFGVLRLERDDLVVHDIGLLRAVEVLDVVDEPALVEEGVGALHRNRDRTGRRRIGRVDLDVAAAHVGDRDAQPLVQERVLLEAGAQCLVVELDGLEDVGTRPERGGRAGFIARLVFGERRVGHADGEGLPPHMPLPANLDVEAARERIDHG